MTNATQLNRDMDPVAAAKTSGGLARLYKRFVVRRLIWLCGLGGALLLTVGANVALGPAGLSVSEVVTGIFNPALMSAQKHVILWDIRLPFAMMAVVVGACLGLAGAEMQTVLNNPLASPSTLGVMHAATVGASLAIVFQLPALGIPENYIVPVCAFAGALASITLIQFLARLYGASANTIVLFGIASVFALDALISLVQFIADTDTLQQIIFWTMGSLSRATWEKVFIVGAVFAVCLPFSIRQVWQLTALRGGEEYARSYGVAVDRLRKLVLLRVSLMTAAAIAFTGIIGFVGLVAPHIARIALGEDHRFYLPGSALAGAVIMSGASLLSKSIVPGIMIPDGIVTALIGIPLFLWLLLTQRRGL